MLGKLTDKYDDALAPFYNVAGFTRGMLYYPKTLFRFPLRTSSSELSEVVYTFHRIEELIEALRGEAKLLLPFLRSVNTIEVHRISPDGIHSLTLKVEVTNSCRPSLHSKRKRFLEQLKSAHSRQSYGISSIIDFNADFHIDITDHTVSSRSVSSHFLVVSTVGSTNASICQAAKKQKVFPWVGTALQLNSKLSNDGRIFCFLPMPVEAASNLPVHVNGTFGLNDDRRSMKWPGLERKNDPTANWNHLLVSELLPSCYVKLLLTAKDHQALTPGKFYQVWPEVKALKGSHWERILLPLFREILKHHVLRSERTEALRQVGEWVNHSMAVLTPAVEKLPSVVHKTLSNCGVKLVTIPQRIRSALKTAKCVPTEVSPSFARGKLKSNPTSYFSIDPIGKGELLRYCLRDKQYKDMVGVNLLPLANGNFIPFQTRSPYYSAVYLVNSSCPRYLLPEQDHILVDTSDDLSLQNNLRDLATSKCTQLALLTASDVARLLPQSMPSSWQSCSIVTLDNRSFPFCWFEKFWNWVRNQDLKMFEGQFVLQTGNNNVVRLKKNEAVLFIPKYCTCSPDLLSAFDKLDVKYSLQRNYPHLIHESLSNYVNKFNADGILDSIYAASIYGHALLTDVEAQVLLSQLSQNKPYLLARRLSVLKGLAMFKSSSNCSSRLCSLDNTNSSSLLRKALVEPPNIDGVVSKLPNNIILLSRDEYNQTTLLNWVNVEKPTEANFLLKYIFPLIRSKSLQDNYIDALMGEILRISQVLFLRNRSFSSSLSLLPFVTNGLGYRQSPVNLFDPSNEALKELYKGEQVFPTDPYNSSQWLQFLRHYCGLRTSVRPDEILSIISSIKFSGKRYPQSVNLTQYTRAKAILQYITTSSFQSQCTGRYYLSECRCHLPFETALSYLTQNFCWLPVLSERPSGYPSALPWKGEGYTCHFFTLEFLGAVMTYENKQLLPYIVGSQVYLTDPKDTPSTQLSGINNLCAHVIEHLKVAISHYESIPQQQLSSIMNKIYSFLNSQSKANVQNLISIPKWIYIAKHNVFVSPSVVAIDQNVNFRNNLEPYLFILPESLSPYSSLFTSFGVNAQATQSQIISVLDRIRKSVEENNTSLYSSHVWSTVMSILNWLTEDGTKEPNFSCGDKLYVPAESDSEWPQLMKSSDVVYTDNDFLKNFLKTSSSDESYTFVHSRISPQMAKCLGITPLSDSLDITEDTFEDTGQHEPLTVRLKNILRDYKDGLTIAKELLQNADDAEATEVNFCYDARNHRVDPNSLFFPEMLHSHGPALLVHNNKTFSKEDFENITKLAAATKQNKPLKIGKFGIGFCSVYHITDVPSFASQDCLTIFDPTMNFLKKEIKNPSRPGKKVKFTSQLIKQSQQLLPYKGLFGFDPQQQYNGTLFRLPFRTSASELSGTCYTEDHHIKSLIEEMKACSSNLILFLQHVNKITFQVIKDGESQPTVVLEIVKSVKVPSIPSVTNTCVKEILCRASQLPEMSSYWIVSSHSTTLTGKHATASVAASVSPETSGSYKTDTALEGELFCFLPLSQKTGLPVHVSCNFAVINNRQGIWTSDDTSYILNEEVCWNVSLMQSVIPQAYHQLLLAIKHMHGNSINSEYLFYSLWPLKESLKLKNPWTTMITQLYELISSSNLFYSSNIANWLHLSQSKFLSPDILERSSEIGEDDCISEILKYLKIPVVYLPMKYHSNFQLEDYTISEDDFLSIFFENLQKFSQIRPARNQLILLMLEVYAAEYDDGSKRSYTFQYYFENYACIPCAPDGSVLKKCSELINPSAPFAKLYDKEENRFPIKQLTDRHFACSSLNDLGMKSEQLPYKYVIERAQTISDLYRRDKRKAKNRIKLILTTIHSYMEDKEQTLCITLDSVPFLPVLSKPCDYPLSWAGDGQELMKGKDLTVHTVSRKHTSENYGIIAGTQVAFVNEKLEEGCGELNRKLQRILKVRNSPSCAEVVQQIKNLVKFFNPKTATDDLKRWVDRACRQVYRFLAEKESEEDIKVIQQLTEIPCVWSGKMFLRSQQIAKNWPLHGPYLHCVPSILSVHKRLCKVLNVKEEFGIADVQNALKKMKADFCDEPVSEACQLILKELVSYFLKIAPEEFSDFKILLPDENYVLEWSTDLAYNDAPWAPKDDTYRYVNDIIPRNTAVQLHVKPVRAKFLEKYVNPNSKFRGAEFGQREELTRRIQNILQDYPFDVTVLKELLQNADDAKASKMYVILDKRTHGKESVLSDNWQKLQGPALLVWNDSIFSEKDLEGIQELGLGSKRSEAESIGQYGIGFNSVYHLTDCPSFITSGDTLCVMDPHCTYVPGAEPLNPGRRFDNLKSGFWDEFKDMKSAYLQSKVDHMPGELLGGSLFRFPLRSTYNLLKLSKIVKDLSQDTLNSSRMQVLLDNWAPKMKAAMFFLNNVRELKFFVIEENSRSLHMLYHYSISVSVSAQERCDLLRQKLSAFTEQRGCEPYIVMYPLTVNDLSSSGSISEKKNRERWIIQQGIGDMMKPNQTWAFVRNVKPRHGIAAPLDIANPSSKSQFHSRREGFRGQVFCFLPLPICSNLPVHINGHFILNSTRRQLWHSTNPDEEDGYTVWNKSLLSAIASSYAIFLEKARQYFADNEYSKLNVLQDDIANFYSIFPKAESSSLDTNWQSPAKECYEKLCKSNPDVLAVIKQIGSHEKRGFKVSIAWHPITSVRPSTQVYFWSETSNQKKTFQPIFEAIGMKITPAPYKLHRYINNALPEDQSTRKCPSITPCSVFAYYTQYSSQVAACQFPCDISMTSFKTVVNFKLFTTYVLQASPESPEKLFFPESPFDHPLLLTADGKLRKFDNGNMVLFSHFVSFFPKSSARFIHPDLLDVKYTKDYFASDECDSNLVNNILLENVPYCLFNCEEYFSIATSVISIQRLQQLWMCFTNDPVFKNTLKSILCKWALILTTDNELFSNKCCLHPIMPPSQDDHHHREIFQVFRKIEMPIVNTAVVCATDNTLCPSISEHSKVLTSLFYLNKENVLLSKLTGTDISILVKYLQAINYRTEQSCCDEVKSLPLFETVDEKFTALSGLTAFIWPSLCSCKVAYSKWSRGFSVAFLEPYASWSQLCSHSDLGISGIQVEDMYIKYIFPHFHLMSEYERYEHLEYIRDSLFNTNQSYLASRVSKVVRHRANLFINALKVLECIGEDGHPLYPISHYCDHEEEIFTAFSSHFNFLPKYFTRTKLDSCLWLPFFRTLGLKTTIAHAEFIRFCSETAQGQNADVKKASSVLINSLFSAKEEWYNHPGFLHQVSKISFLCCENLPHLTWLASSIETRRIMQKDECIDMTQPAKAALVQSSTVLWTVKPVVSLPEKEDILTKLCVCTKPLVSDVLQNLKNISQGSKYANIGLFHKYPKQLRPLEGGKRLSEIYLDHFNILQGHLSSTDLDNLQNIPCVPVYASPDLALRSEMVLVKPQSVLTCKVSDYNLFLHKLPSDFTYVVPLMESIGVKRELGLKHMQIVLESAQQFSNGEETDINTHQCVKEAVKLIYILLSRKKEDKKATNTTLDEDNRKLLSPLFLLNKSKRLVLSTQLLYHDAWFLNKIVLDLSNTLYSELDIPYLEYKFFRSDFCNLLPPSLRPRGTLQVCDAKVAPECRSCDLSNVAKKVSTNMQLSALPKVILITLKHNLPKDKTIGEEAQSHLDKFFKEITVVNFKDLKIVILLKGTTTVLGRGKVPYFLQEKDSGYVLSINSGIKEIEILRMYSELAKLLISTLQEVSTFTVPSDFRTTVEHFLKAESATELMQELEFRCIPHGDIAATKDFKLSIGKEVPHEWHYRLDQDVDNIFHANEYVCYEDQDGHFILVRIVHAVMPEDANSETINHYTRKYLIFTNEDDEEGTEVGVLSLYKISKGTKQIKLNQECQMLVPYEGEVTESIADYSDSALKSEKRKLCQELKEIWKLDPENRKRALRRLYLKWHPDRNPENPEFAEEVYKFLRAQIDKLEQGLPLDDPDREESAGYTYAARRHGKSSWWEQFSQWDSTARQHGRHRARDNKNSTPRGSSYGWSHGFPFTAGDENFRVPRQPDEGRRWMLQAAVDHKALTIFNEQMNALNDNTLAGHVCFLAHQLAEKSLKAGMYAVCGLEARDLTDHVLGRHACALQTEQPLKTMNLASHAAHLENYYIDTRYPNRHIPPTIPAGAFTLFEAEEAYEHATKVYSIVQSLFNK